MWGGKHNRNNNNNNSNNKNSGGGTQENALVTAVENRQAVKLRTLLERNPEDVQCRKGGEGGPTLVMLAIANGFLECVALLMEFGADPLMKGMYWPNELSDAYELAIALKGTEDNKALETLLAGRKGKQEAAEPDVYRYSQATATLLPMPFHPEIRIKKVACGQGCSALLTDGGTVFTWGSSQYGKLGLPNKAESFGPRRVFGELAHRTAVDLAVGKDHMIVLDDMGRVFGWGVNKNRQLGYEHKGDMYYVETPQEVPTLRGLKIVAVDAGEMHTVFLESSGFVFAAGLALQGRLGAVSQHACSQYRGEPLLVQFGKGTKEQRISPAEVTTRMAAGEGFQPSIKIVKISCGKNHSAAVDEFGNVHCWGMDPDGRCGQPKELKPVSGGRGDHRQAADLSAVYTPFQVPNLAHVSFVHCGMNMTFCTLQNGSVVCFGGGSCAQLILALGDVREYCACKSDYGSHAAITNNGELHVASMGDRTTVSCVNKLTSVSTSGFGILALSGRDRSALGEALKQMYQTSLFCDVRFICQGGSLIDGHRGVICARLERSSGMRGLLLNPPESWERVQQGESSLLIVHLDDVHADVLDLLLLYIYSDRTTVVSAHASALLDLSLAWGCQGLVDVIKGLNPRSVLQQNILQLQQDDELRDRTADFVIAGAFQSFKCHKGILAARSDYYRAMLCGGFSEGSNNQMEIILEGPLTASRGPSTEVVPLMLEFLYSNTLETLDNPNDALELLQLANNMQLMRLVFLCEASIEESLDPESVAYVWVASRLTNAAHLERYCVEYARIHWKAVAQTRFYLQLMEKDDVELFRLASDPEIGAKRGGEGGGRRDDATFIPKTAATKTTTSSKPVSNSTNATGTKVATATTTTNTTKSNANKKVTPVPLGSSASAPPPKKSWFSTVWGGGGGGAETPATQQVAPPPVSKSDDVNVLSLMEMGYGRENALRALAATKHRSLEEAASWLIENVVVEAAHPQEAAWIASVMDVTSVDERAAREALIATKWSGVERAVEHILNL